MRRQSGDKVAIGDDFVPQVAVAALVAEGEATTKYHHDEIDMYLPVITVFMMNWLRTAQNGPLMLTK